MAEKEWSEDPEDDPIKLQKEQIALGKKFMAKMEEAEAKEKKRREEYAEAPSVYGIAPAMYKPPTFEEVSANIKKAWEEVERIIPTAPDEVKVYTFQALAAAVRGGFIA